MKIFCLDIKEYNMEMCEKYKDKKIFICHVYGMNSEYSILAKNDEEAKKY